MIANKFAFRWGLCAVAVSDASRLSSIDWRACTVNRMSSAADDVDDGAPPAVGGAGVGVEALRPRLDATAALTATFVDAAAVSMRLSCR